MKTIPIPVRMVGAGSHVEEEELQYLDMPRDMRTFSMPEVPQNADQQALAAARDLLAAFLTQLNRWSPGVGANPRMDLSAVPPATLKVVNEMLGDGEVQIRVTGARRFDIQESVFTGLWRVIERDDGERAIADSLEAGPLPQVVLETAQQGSAAALAPVTMPAGAMNSPALLHEIAARIAPRRGKDKPHVLNLTLFPLTPEDHQVLDSALARGPVSIMSRGFGNCRITSTVARRVWRVQYFNSMNTMILNTIEVVDVPEVALAAPEDLADTRGRLAELIDWMSETCPA